MKDKIEKKTDEYKIHIGTFLMKEANRSTGLKGIRSFWSMYKNLEKKGLNEVIDFNFEEWFSSSIDTIFQGYDIQSKNAGNHNELETISENILRERHDELNPGFVSKGSDPF